MAENVLLEKQDINGFLFAEDYGAYVFYTTPAPYSLEANGEYIILWDDVEHTRTAFSFTAADGAACVGVGNPVAAGLEANEDRFAIVYDSTNSVLYYFSLVEGERHNVQVSQIVEDVEPEPEPDPEPEEPETPEGIVLKDRNGNDVAYYGIETVTFDTTTEGKQQTYTKGVAVEDLEIVPDFSGGDVTVKAPDGTLVKSAVIKKPTVESFVVGESEGAIPLDFSSGESIEVTPSVESAFISELTIQKPEALVPENIAEGVNIAGVVGAFAGGGANVVFNRGSFSGLTDNPITIDHGLGVTPDIIVISTNGFTSITTNYILYNFVGFSSALVQAMTDGNLDSGNGLSQVYTRAMYSTVYNTYKSYRVTGGEFFGTTTAIDISEPSSMRFIYGANETSFKIINKAGQYGYIDSTLTYRWYAIGGLT